LSELAAATCQSREAIVVPALEVSGAAWLPRTKVDAAAFMEQGLAEGFHMSRYPKGHRATDFNRWLETSEGSGEEYPVEYEIGFEPYVVCRRTEVPRYDARFRGYGLNKVSHLYRMANVSNFSFVVAGGPFAAALEHEPSADFDRTYGNSKDTQQVARIQALWNIATEEMIAEAVRTN